MFRYYLDLAWRRCRQGPSMVLLLTFTMAIGIASCMTALTIFSALSGEPLPGISPHLQVVTMDAREALNSKDNDYSQPDSYLTLLDAKALVDARRARQHARRQQQSQLSPFQLSQPSFPARPAITSAAAGSAHHQPNKALASRPTSSAIER